MLRSIGAELPATPATFHVDARRNLQTEPRSWADRYRRLWSHLRDPPPGLTPPPSSEHTTGMKLWKPRGLQSIFRSFGNRPITVAPTIFRWMAGITRSPRTTGDGGESRSWCIPGIQSRTAGSAGGPRRARTSGPVRRPCVVFRELAKASPIRLFPSPTYQTVPENISALILDRLTGVGWQRGSGCGGVIREWGERTFADRNRGF